MSDTDLANQTGYKVSVEATATAQIFDAFYIETCNSKFRIQIAYPLGDEDTMNEMYQLFYDVEFIPKS